MAVHRKVITQYLINFPMERETVSVKNLASEHNTMTRSGLEPRPLTTRSPAHYNHEVTTSPEKDQLVIKYK